MLRQQLSRNISWWPLSVGWWSREFIFICLLWKFISLATRCTRITSFHGVLSFHLWVFGTCLFLIVSVILLVILHSLPPTSVKVFRSSWWAFHWALRLEKMEFKVIPVTNSKIITDYLSLHLLCLPTLSFCYKIFGAFWFCFSFGCFVTGRRCGLGVLSPLCWFYVLLLPFKLLAVLD